MQDIKIHAERLIEKLREIKEAYGTLTDCEILHILDFARFDWHTTAHAYDYRRTADFFVWCVECDVFDHVTDKHGRKFSSFGGFNRSGYRQVEAFLRTLENYVAIQWMEYEQRDTIEGACLIAYSVLSGAKTLEQYEAALLSQPVDFFPKTNMARATLAHYNNQKKQIEVARTIVEAMPDFDLQQFWEGVKSGENYANDDLCAWMLPDFVTVAESVLGYERPAKRLSVEDGGAKVQWVQPIGHLLKLKTQYNLWT